MHTTSYNEMCTQLQMSILNVCTYVYYIMSRLTHDVISMTIAINKGIIKFHRPLSVNCVPTRIPKTPAKCKKDLSLGGISDRAIAVTHTASIEP